MLLKEEERLREQARSDGLKEHSHLSSFYTSSKQLIGNMRKSITEKTYPDYLSPSVCIENLLELHDLTGIVMNRLEIIFV